MGGLDLEGEIPLEDELYNPMLKDFNVTKGGYDVETFIPGNISNGLAKQKYTLEFTLDGTDLTAGTILNGKKLGAGYPRYGELLTTDGEGNLYVFGVLVHTGGTSNVKIALAFDDALGVVKAYINGQEIPGTIDYKGDFALDDGVIRSFIFKDDCGGYSVKGLIMYTGNDVQ
jgi:hypothetical protein